MRKDLIPRHDNEMFKESLAEIAIIGLRAGVSSIPLATVMIDLVAGGLRLSNDETIRTYIKNLEDRINDLQINLDELSKCSAYQELNSTFISNIRSHYSKLDISIEAELAVRMSRLDYSIPLNQMLFNAVSESNPLLLKVFWIMKCVEGLKEDEKKWDQTINKFTVDDKCNWHDRLSVLYGKYLDMYFADSLGTSVTMKIGSLGLSQPINIFTADVSDYYFNFPGLSAVGFKLAGILDHQGAFIQDELKSVTGLTPQELRSEMKIDFDKRKIEFSV